MKNRITRRDFLRLVGLLPLSAVAPKFINPLPTAKKAGKSQNVIVVVFDAFSAYNISIYGYKRETTPNIVHWAEQAVVYHNHYAGGNFTIPGTASLLTGTLPWTHRAISFNKNLIEKTYLNKNIFSAFPNHYRVAYTHNPVANTLLTQFNREIDEYVPLGKLFLTNDDFIYSLFKTDQDTANLSWTRTMEWKDNGYAYSLFLTRLYEEHRERVVKELRSQFPRGIPHIDQTANYFLLEDAVDWLENTLSTLPQPFMGYFHFLPPHFPYLTHRDFQGYFTGDDFSPILKSPDVFSKKEYNKTDFLLRKRTEYDEFLLYVDREFGKLMDKLETLGALENTLVVLTSDHGEMFERGILGHITPVLYQPLIRVPLIIFEPGRGTRTDIYSNTSTVDLLPTLLYLTGQKQADWCEGEILPPYTSANTDLERNLFVVEAKKNDQYRPLTIATVALVKGRYKLIYFFGYKQLGVGKERIELYDIRNDPEEMNDLFSLKRETSNDMLHELKAKLAEVNKPYF